MTEIQDEWTAGECLKGLHNESAEENFETEHSF